MADESHPVVDKTVNPGLADALASDLRCFDTGRAYGIGRPDEGDLRLLPDQRRRWRMDAARCNQAEVHFGSAARRGNAWKLRVARLRAMKKVLPKMLMFLLALAASLQTPAAVSPAAAPAHVMAASVDGKAQSEGGAFRYSPMPMNVAFVGTMLLILGLSAMYRGRGRRELTSAGGNVVGALVLFLAATAIAVREAPGTQPGCAAIAPAR